MRRIGIAECLPGSSWIPAQPGPIARFRLVVPFLAVRISLTYEVIRFVPDREVLLHASNGVLQATDRIVVTGTADGSTASYDTEMRLRGTLQVLARPAARFPPWQCARPPGVPRLCLGARRVLGPRRHRAHRFGPAGRRRGGAP